MTTLFDEAKSAFSYGGLGHYSRYAGRMPTVLTVDSARWTGRTHQIRFNVWSHGLVAYKVERYQEEGTMCPALGILLGNDVIQNIYCKFSIIIGYNRYHFFPRGGYGDQEFRSGSTGRFNE